jgi:hypothetical protein
MALATGIALLRQSTRIASPRQEEGAKSDERKALGVTGNHHSRPDL